MNTQEAYKKIRAHLLSMKRPCRDDIADVCLYNGPNGEHCAVGILLTGIFIPSKHNILNISKLCLDNKAVKNRLCEVDPRLLTAAQEIHDNKKNWNNNGLNEKGKAMLDSLAITLGLCLRKAK